MLAPSHVLLVDSRGQVREIYQAGDQLLPAELLANPVGVGRGGRRCPAGADRAFGDHVPT
jgi:hypothetical protein